MNHRHTGEAQPRPDAAAAPSEMPRQELKERLQNVSRTRGELSGIR